MPSDKLNKLWLLAVFILITIILTNSLFIWLRSSHGQPVTVLPPPEPGFSGEIYIDGAVGRPGIYPLNTGESLESLIRACGGAVDNADLSAMRLYIPQRGESPGLKKLTSTGRMPGFCRLCLASEKFGLKPLLITVSSLARSNTLRI